VKNRDIRNYRNIRQQEEPAGTENDKEQRL